MRAVEKASGELGDLAARVAPVVLAGDRRLEVLASLGTLLPDGLARGAVVGVGAGRGVDGATSLALALVAGPSQAGAWVAVVGGSSLGWVAAADLGVELERLVVVDVARPALAGVVAALVDGFDVVVLGAGVSAQLRAGEAQRLVARVRERGAVLVTIGPGLAEAVGVRLEVVAGMWDGVEAGAGRLARRRVTVEASGRGAASRVRRAELWLPGGDGALAGVDPGGRLRSVAGR